MNEPHPFAHLIGRRVLFVGDHPWKTHAGEVVRVERPQMLGGQPSGVVRLDNGAAEAGFTRRADVQVLD